jgi:SAM-dependent methyltransferase
VDDILILGNHASKADFPAEIYSILYQTEGRHFWNVGRDRVFVDTLRQVLGDLRGVRLLDVGCGTGQILSILETYGMSVCGLDMQLEGMRYARKRTQAPLVCFNSEEMPFVGQFDVVSCCDVLEHVDDELAVLRGCRKALKAGGLIVLTVPASMKLWSIFDELNGHKRRYVKSELGSAIEQAGFCVEHIEYFNSLLFPFQYLYRKRMNWDARKGPALRDAKALYLQSLYPPPRLVNTLFSALLWAERTLFSWLAWPFGSSLVAVARNEDRQ